MIKEQVYISYIFIPCSGVNFNYVIILILVTLHQQIESRVLYACVFIPIPLDIAKKNAF